MSRESQALERQMRGKRLHQGISLADKQRLHKRREQALSLRIAGATLQDIVNAKIGYNTTQMVSHDIKKSLSGFYAEDVEELLILDLARLDEMQKFCTAALRNGDTSQVRNLMAIMEFRRTTMGVTAESIQDRRLSAAQVVNNGIMVVQGSTREYLGSMMEAAGASPEEIENEFLAIEKTSESNKSAGQKIIDAEIVPEVPTDKTMETTPQTGAGSPVSPVDGTADDTSKRRRRLVVKRRGAAAGGAPGSGGYTAGTPLDEAAQLAAHVESIAERMEREQDEGMEMRLGGADAPAVLVDVEKLGEILLGKRSHQQEQKVFEFPVKLPDANAPVSPGVAYKNPPRKPTVDEGIRQNSRKLRRPATSHESVITRVYEQEI